MSSTMVGLRSPTAGIAALISSSDLPSAIIPFTLFHFSSTKANFVLTSSFVNTPPWSETYISASSASNPLAFSIQPATEPPRSRWMTVLASGKFMTSSVEAKATL